MLKREVGVTQAKMSIVNLTKMASKWISIRIITWYEDYGMPQLDVESKTFGVLIMTDLLNTNLRSFEFMPTDEFA